MLEHDRIDTSERIDANKTRTSKECDIFHICWYFLNKGFNFELYVCLQLLSRFNAKSYEL